MPEKAKHFIGELSKELKGARCKISKHERAIWVGVAAEKLPDSCMALVSRGAVFDSAFAYPSARNSWAVAYVFRVAQISALAIVRSQGKKFYSVCEKIPAALWDERKMHELTGVQFIGLADTRPIMMHPENAHISNIAHGKHGREEHSGTYEFSGTGTEGEFEVPVGPVHAGIIEPGHFRFFVSGEGINKLEARLSYLHRGIEEFAKGKKILDAFGFMEQVSGDESVANSVAFAQAAEFLLGIKAPRRAEALRLILLEEERICSHLADLGGISTDVGYSTSASQFMALRENMMRLNEKYFGNRFMRNIIAIGGVRRDIAPEKLHELALEIKEFSKSLLKIGAFTLSCSTFLDRAFTAGTIFRSSATKLSLVGPAARASGISCDARKGFPYGAYRHVHVNEEIGASGDALGRFMLKLNEAKESARLIYYEISHMHAGPVCANSSKARAKEGQICFGMCEAPRGCCTILLQAGKNNTIKHLGIRTASFRNWRALEKAVKGNIIADFPLINKSFNLSYAGADL